MVKVTRIRAGLYGVDAGNGNVYTVENMQAPGNGYGTQWMWYSTPAAGAFGIWFDPTFTKREAIEQIATYFA